MSTSPVGVGTDLTPHYAGSRSVPEYVLSALLAHRFPAGAVAQFFGLDALPGAAVSGDVVDTLLDGVPRACPHGQASSVAGWPGGPAARRALAPRSPQIGHLPVLADHSDIHFLRRRCVDRRPAGEQSVIKVKVGPGSAHRGCEEDASLCGRVPYQDRWAPRSDFPSWCRSLGAAPLKQTARPKVGGPSLCRRSCLTYGRVPTSRPTVPASRTDAMVEFRVEQHRDILEGRLREFEQRLVTAVDTTTPRRCRKWLRALSSGG